MVPVNGAPPEQTGLIATMARPPGTLQGSETAWRLSIQAWEEKYADQP